MKKKPSMQDIATMLGISVNAVSLALNKRKGVSEGLRLKIFELADSLGYLEKKPRISRLFEHYTFCIMIQEMYTHGSFHELILSSVSKTAGDNGYNTLLYYFNNESRDIPDCVSRHYVSGIIIIGTISNRLVEKLLPFGIHIVIIDYLPMQYHINCVLADNRSGGFIAARHLLRAGFRKLGYFGDLFYTNSVRDRYYGFLEALIQEGIITYGDREAYTNQYSITGNIEPLVIKSDTAAVADILDRRAALPEAFFCSNDMAAIVLINALRKKGIRVPADISVVGFDNNAMAEKVVPKLTTIHVNRELMGRKAVQRLIDLTENENRETEHTVVWVELVERDSVMNKSLGKNR
ncbi:MAG: LacI family DNA-binding transcriptional regulator [Treponema sp.]|jgi:LacI family transcriptional regulator|nr:LacI family DNA-binding transcriptional regulator [Treponema sp.]